MFFLTMKRFFRKLFIRILVLATLVAGAFWYVGYREYQKTIEEKPLDTLLQAVKTESSYLTYEQIPVIFLDAVVSVEDERFYERDSVLDAEALLRATWTNLKNFSLVQGGSTIPQQVSKNLYYDHHASLVRKVAEYYLTKDLMESQSKQQILSLYIHIIYYGNGAYGLMEASENYFGLKPWELNDGELTLLAGLPQAPSTYDLTSNFEGAKQRQKHVLDRMVKKEKLTEKQAEDIYHMEVMGYE